MTIDVRHVRGIDLADFAPVIDAGFKRVPLTDRAASYRAVGFKANHKAIAAYSGECIVGALYWMRWNGRAFVQLVYVLPSYRRRGVYRKMLGALCQVAQRRRLTGISAAVDDANHRSLVAHNRLGFDDPIHYLVLPFKA